MKRILALSLSVVLIIALVGCGNETNKKKAASNNLYSKAITILDELSEDQRVKDFRTAYDLLMTLPSDEDKFVSQLGEASKIFDKYDVELDSGDYYLNSTVTVTKEGVDKYRTKGAYHDANDLLETIVFPVLFEKYGNEAQSIKGLSADKVISAIKTTNDYSFCEKKEQYDSCKEEWEYIGVPKSKYEVRYYSNGLVESVDIPIVRSENPLNDTEYVAFVDKEIETQKQLAGSRFMSMSNQFSTIFTGYEVLSLIFTDEEIAIISNYIHSLTLEDIWERNLLALSGDPTIYVSAIVVFDYKGNTISINYGLNDITLTVTDKNYVNPLSHRWHTLWLGLCWPDGSEETIEGYKDYINNNTAYNDIIQEYSFNLDANADKFSETPTTNFEQTQSKNEQNDVQDSIPIDLLMNEEVIVRGVIEKNDGAFPNYRLHLNTKLSVIFTDDDSDKIYICEYMYFYDDPELNGNYPLADFVGDNCEVTALLEDYRGGDELFLLNPVITMN